MKRLRKPKLKDGELRVYWGRSQGDNPDVVFAWQGEPSMKRDSLLLYYHMGIQRPDPNGYPLYSKMRPSLLKDLEARGYDITTLRFSIMKKSANTTLTGKRTEEK